MLANGIAVAEPTTSPPRQTPLPGARLALIMLLAINLFNYIDRYILAAVEPNVRADLLAGDPDAKAKTGLLSTAFLLTYMCISPVFGWLGDRMSRWWLIAIGVILWSLASGASGFPWGVPLAHAYTVLLITRCFVGIGEGAYGPVAPTLISDLYPVKVRGKVLAWFYAAIPVGSALGYAIGDLIRNSPLGWRWAFYVVMPPGILLGLLCVFMREPPRGQADAAQASRPTRLKDYWTLLRTPSYVLDTLGMTAMTFGMGALGYWMPAYLEARQAPNLGPLPAGAAFGALTVVAGFSATLLGGMLGDWLRPRFSGSYFLVSGVAMLIGFPMVWLVTTVAFPMNWLCLFLAVFFLFFNTGPTNTILANVTHPSIRATAFALNIFVLHALGDAISPPLIGLIADHYGAKPGHTEVDGLNAGFITVSLMILVGGVLWIWGARYLAEDTRLAPLRLGPEAPADDARSG
jgi:MFS family permease